MLPSKSTDQSDHFLAFEDTDEPNNPVHISQEEYRTDQTERQLEVRETFKIQSKDRAKPKTSTLLKIWLKLAVPAIVSNVAGFLCLAVNSAFASQLDDPVMLAAVGVGNVCCFIFIISILTGLNSAQETLTSQAYGSGNQRLCGVYLNRGRLILTTFFIPLALVTGVFSEQILLAVGQDPQVASQASGYIKMFLPGLFFFGQFDLLKRFLAAMRVTFIPMVAQVAATLLHLPLCYLLVINRQLGLRGLGLATTITNFNLLLIEVSLPSTVIICSEWWAFEVLTIISGLISVEAQAVQTIVTSGCAILFEIPLGYQEATCAIIGNCIGANNVPLAKRFFRLTLGITLATVLTLQLAIILSRDAIAKFYSSEADVQTLTSSVLMLVALIFFFDGMQGFLQGPIRAVGLQKRASCYTLVCYYGIGIPVACLLSLKYELGVIGLQIGVGIAIALQFASYVTVLARSNWQAIADQAKQRIEQEAKVGQGGECQTAGDLSTEGSDEQYLRSV